MINANVDDVVDSSVAVAWINAGQNQMAAEARAEFTQIDATNADSTFDFPPKYHEIPILYACGMYMASESSVGEKNAYLGQFNEGLKTFIENYDVPMNLRDDSTTQQFTSTANQTTFLITKRSYSTQSNLKVFINNIQTYDFELLDTSFILTTAPTTGSKVTAIWEDRPDLQEPPYTWWKW